MGVVISLYYLRSTHYFWRIELILCKCFLHLTMSSRCHSIFFTSRAIAMLLARLNDGSGGTNDAVLHLFQTILQMLSVTSALQKIVASMVLIEWTNECQVIVFGDRIL